MYASRGLFPYGTNADIDKRDVTVVAVRGDRAVATLTVRMDFGNGLLADTCTAKRSMRPGQLAAKCAKLHS